MINVANALGVEIMDNKGNEKGFLTVMKEISNTSQELRDKVAKEFRIVEYWADSLQ